MKITRPRHAAEKILVQVGDEKQVISPNLASYPWMHDCDNIYIGGSSMEHLGQMPPPPFPPMHLLPIPLLQGFLFIVTSEETTYYAENLGSQAAWKKTNQFTSALTGWRGVRHVYHL